MSKIKLVVCDLDGTLLNDDKMISEYTIQVIKQVNAMGVKICFASGRDEQMMAVYNQCIGGCDYVLSNNGAQVRDRDGRILYEVPLESDSVKSILAYLNNRNMTYMMYTPKSMYFTRDSLKLKKRLESYEKLSSKIGYPVCLEKEGIGADRQGDVFSDVGKIVAYEESEEIMADFISFVEGLKHVHGESTGYGLQGAFHEKSSKKTALQKIMEELQIGEEEVCVFGDYDNDASMFECAATRVAMGNAVNKLKQMASVVTLSNNEDGVAHFLADEFEIII